MEAILKILKETGRKGLFSLISVVLVVLTFSAISIDMYSKVKSVSNDVSEVITEVDFAKNFNPDKINLDKLNAEMQRACKDMNATGWGVAMNRQPLNYDSKYFISYSDPLGQIGNMWSRERPLSSNEARFLTNFQNEIWWSGELLPEQIEILGYVEIVSIPIWVNDYWIGYLLFTYEELGYDSYTQLNQIAKGVRRDIECLIAEETGYVVN